MRRWPAVPAIILALAVAAAGFGVLGRSEPAAPPTVTTAAAVYLPGEFDPQQTLLLGGSQLVNLFPQVMADIATAVAGAVDLRILAGSAADHASIDSLLANNGVTASISDLPIRTMWLRDFGPLTVADAHGNRRLVDFFYRERRGNKTDDGVPGHLATLLDLPISSSPLLVEGGDFIGNGRGFCLMSTRVVNRNAHYLKLEPREVVTDFAAALGYESVSLALPLAGESTGHVDMLAAFLAVDLVVIGQYPAAVDSANAGRLDQLAADLATRSTLQGPLRVERIPMPDHNDGIWRTYTNIVQANNVVLVPVYPDYCPDLDARALAVYRRLLPTRRIVGLDASRLIRMNGALRCITVNVAWGRAAVQHEDGHR